MRPRTVASETKMSDQKVHEWVELAVKNENLLEFEVAIHGKTGKGDGYMGKITFVTVTGKTKDGEKKIFDFVIKISATNKLLRKQIPVKKIFENEIFIYNEVVPTFENFQKELGIRHNLLDFLPKCYVTHNVEDFEMLILENLKVKGFDVWDRQKPMTDDYIRLLLQGFAKWHAFSFALQKKRPEIFAELVKNNVNRFSYNVLTLGIDDAIFEYFEEVRTAWRNDEEIQSLKFSKEDIRNAFRNLFSEEAGYQVVLHGDCWTNNFMFKLEGKTGPPSKVCIIDWQCSGVASPVMDLSFFIYTCVDTDTHKDVQELLKIYYENLSAYLEQFGCEPLVLFSYDKLLEHWKRFSVYGLLIATFILKITLSESEDVPDFAETAEQGKEFRENFKFTSSNLELFYKRVKHNILHYLRNLK